MMERQKSFGLAVLTSEGKLDLSPEAQVLLRDLLAKEPGAEGFAVRPQDSGVMLQPATQAKKKRHKLSQAERTETIAWMRESMAAYATGDASLDDELIDGLTYREYFALSDEEREEVWDEAFSDLAMDIDDYSELEVPPDAVLAARQKHSS
jgi:hypothetical protein